MSEEVKLRRGTTAENSVFTGAEGEVVVDKTKDTLVVHDGVTVGGHSLAKEDLSTSPEFGVDTKGLVPAPTVDDAAKALFGDGTWKVVVADGGAGEDGKSAYEVALDNGFVGTEVEWLASLKGADGAQGPAGAAGAQGPKGDTGDAGAQGPKGDTGTAGADGAPGATGATGPAGSTGPGYTSATVDGTGHLILTKTDTTTVDVGLVKGTDGATGLQGPKGDTGAAGAAGAAGASVLYGTVAPLDTQGNNGDVYVMSNGNLYTKAAGTWTYQSSLLGPQGPKGDTGAAGSAAQTQYINNNGLAYTLALTDTDKYIRFTASGVKTITVPANATVAFGFATTGTTTIFLLNSNAQTMTIAAASGVTLNRKPSKGLTVAQQGIVCLMKVGTDTWDLMGDLDDL